MTPDGPDRARRDHRHHCASRVEAREGVEAQRRGDKRRRYSLARRPGVSGRRIGPGDHEGGLDEINSSDEPFGTRIVEFGLFEEIGAVTPGTTKSYRLRIPYAKLELSGATGAYRVGVSVLAANRDGRDFDADARADTVLSLVSDVAAAPTEVVTVVPVTAPVTRHASGNFLDDRLAAEISAGGRLRNLVDFLAAVPAGTVEIVADPALLNALQDMSDGYVVATRQQEADQGTGRNGTGEVAARDWLEDFDSATSRHDLLLMAWGSPDASALALRQMPGIVQAAVHASEEYAVDQGLIAPTVSWQKGGASTRRGLVVARAAGAAIQFVSADSLVNLRAEADSAYLPSLVTVRTATGELTAAVTAGELAGQRLTSRTSLLDFRQDLMAEATIRSSRPAWHRRRRWSRCPSAGIPVTPPKSSMSPPPTSSRPWTPST
ncbi:MAG: hypothetical protein WKF73_13620 [Nocardioidaceae bacterium]